MGRSERFRIISRLGAGGMGEAFRAWDTLNGVPVVLKRPLPAYARRKDVLERFDREINRLLELSHRHIVPIVGHGHDATGLPFLAMRFLPGGSLADRSKPQAAGRLHGWLPDIAAALDFVHSCGVLHRDVKPGNVFFDAQGAAYLGDFGIAKVIEEEIAGGAEEALTSTGENIGTSAYMAPEFFRQPRVLSGAYDQYALGITVYEMVCGKRPFAGDSGQLIVAHVTQQPPDIRTVHADAPASFCEAVARSLAKKPEERFPTCAAFVEAALRDIPAVAVDDGVYRFMCPACRKLVNVRREAGGREGRCTQCGARLRVSDNLDALWLRQEDPVSTAGGGDPADRTAITELVAPTVAAESETSFGKRYPGLVLGLTLLCAVIIGAAGTPVILRVRALSHAREVGDWDTVLTLVPDDPDALLNRAVRRLAETPPDLEAVFADLEVVRRVNASSGEMKMALGRAHAVRSEQLALAGNLQSAETNLAEAEGFDAPEECSVAARQAIAAGWVREAQSAVASRDSVKAQRAIESAERRGADPAALEPLKVRLLVLQAEALESSGAREQAVERVLQAMALDESVAQELLNASTHADLRRASLARLHRQVFDDAFAKRDWNAVLGALALAEQVDSGAWKWLDAAIAVDAESVATMPSSAMARLPVSTLRAVPVSAVGSLPSLTNSLGMRLRFVPAGAFVLGDVAASGDDPPHPVTLTRAFFLGAYEVTNAEWQKVMGSVPSRWKNGAHPVERVSWQDAVEFCRRMSALSEERRYGRVYRLPTEAEWEYACRAGTTTRYSFGNGGAVESVQEYGWFANNSGREPLDARSLWQANNQEAYLKILMANGCQSQPVGRKQGNQWGLHDMHGNVWEWCNDWFSQYSGEAVTDPKGPAAGTTRVFRGGCWYFDVTLAASAYRISGKESFRRDDLGFRVAFTVEDSTSGALD